MLDVHPPSHTPHGWRDFFVHMATITLGLLIALGLEAMAQGWERHERRIDTRERLEAEVALNRHVLADDLVAIRQERGELEQDLARLQAVGGGISAPALRFGWNWNALTDVAWQTARETGGLALLPNEEVSRLADIYSQQHLLDEAGLALTAGMTRADVWARSTGAQPDAQRAELLRLSADNLAQVAYIEILARGLTKAQ